MKFGMLLRLSGLYISYSFYLIQSIFKGENSSYVILSDKKFNMAWHSDIYRPISFECLTMVETTDLHMFIPVRMTLAFIQGHSCMRNLRNFCTHVLANVSIDLNEILYSATTCWFIEAHANCIYTTKIQGSEPK